MSFTISKHSATRSAVGLREPSGCARRVSQEERLFARFCDVVKKARNIQIEMKDGPRVSLRVAGYAKPNFWVVLFLDAELQFFDFDFP